MINKTGKIGKLNAHANIKLNKLWIEKDIRWCELTIPHDCNQFLGLTNAHRHKRLWYRGKDESLLWSFNQVIRSCVNGHSLIEYDSEKTEAVFNELRGEEKLPLDNSNRT